VGVRSIQIIVHESLSSIQMPYKTGPGSFKMYESNESEFESAVISKIVAALDAFLLCED
ncbi:Hypothetical protein FKW44_015323, partial [Caligus rogercresseyi]